MWYNHSLYGARQRLLRDCNMLFDPALEVPHWEKQEKPRLGHPSSALGLLPERCRKVLLALLANYWAHSLQDILLRRGHVWHESGRQKTFQGALIEARLFRRAPQEYKEGRAGQGTVFGTKLSWTSLEVVRFYKRGGRTSYHIWRLRKAYEAVRKREKFLSYRASKS